jgi:branched-chain amino acid aminotransferase
MSTPPLFVNLNGSLVPAAEARLPLLDHAVLYGDGLFETLRVYGGRFFRLEAHLERLQASSGQLRLSLPWSADSLVGALRDTVRANGIGDGVVRLTVTRGEGPPVPDPARCGKPSFFVTSRPGPPPGEEAFEKGVSACLAGSHPRTFVPGVKSLSYLPFQQARVEARRRGFDDGLLAVGGDVVEGSTGNLFVVREGRLETPDLLSGCLPGITRAAVMELARAAGIPVVERSVSVTDLPACEELFLTSSVAELVPVARWEGRTVGDGSPGPLTRRLRRDYGALVLRELQR